MKSNSSPEAAQGIETPDPQKNTTGESTDKIIQDDYRNSQKDVATPTLPPQLAKTYDTETAKLTPSPAVQEGLNQLANKGFDFKKKQVFDTVVHAIDVVVDATIPITSLKNPAERIATKSLFKGMQYLPNEIQPTKKENITSTPNSQPEIALQQKSEPTSNTDLEINPSLAITPELYPQIKASLELQNFSIFGPNGTDITNADTFKLSAAATTKPDANGNYQLTLNGEFTVQTGENSNISGNIESQTEIPEFTGVSANLGYTAGNQTYAVDFSTSKTSPATTMFTITTRTDLF